MPVNEFFVTLLHAATSMHILHLRTRSYAKHMALDALYTALPGLVDQIIEAYQARYTLIDEYPNGYEPPLGDELAFVVALRNYVDDNRKVAGDDSEIQNLMDELVDLLNSAIYKMRFLS